jgi:TnpA family transposase
MESIHRWQHQYIGSTTLPKDLGVLELQRFFTFTNEELAALSRRKDEYRVAAAIQLGFLRMSGCPLSDLQSLPLRLVRYVAAQLGLQHSVTVTSLRHLYKRSKTRYEQQWWAMTFLGFRKPEKDAMAKLDAYLQVEAAEALSIDALLLSASIWLYQHSYIGVPLAELRALANRAVVASEGAILNHIHRQVSPAVIGRWLSKLMAIRPETGRTTLEWLQQPPRRKSINAIRYRTERVEFLKDLGVDKLDLEPIPIEKVKIYAAEARNIRPAKLRELKEPTRTLRLVCLLKWLLAASTDAAIMLGGRRVTKLMRDAHNKAQELEGKATRPYHATVVEIFEKVDDESLTDEAFRQHVRKLKDQYKPPRYPNRATATRWLLSEPNPEVRALLSELRKLDLQGEDSEPSLQHARILQSLYKRKQTALPDDVVQQLKVPRGWRELIEGEDRERAMRALEAATLVGLRKALRSGAVFVNHSEKFRGRHRVMIDAQQWTRERLNHYGRLGLPSSPDEFLAGLERELAAKLQLLDKAVTRGEIPIVNGRFQVKRFQAFVESSEIKRNRDLLFARIGVVQFPELILEMDSRTGFSKIILGRMARSPQELLEVYAGMLAHGCALDASQVSLTVPQMTADQVLRGMALFEHAPVVRAANEAVVGFQKSLPICTAWGDGSWASSDMMSLDVSKHIWVARLDYRRKQPSVGTYSLVSDFWSVIYDVPIILNERQAGAAIEGAIRQTEVDVERLAVDTHGYTEFAMALAKLLGFALCPRLARFSDRKLCIPSSMKDTPASLSETILPIVSMKAIRQEWDNLVRLAASVETGHVSATVALARFGSASSDSPLYRAGVHLGRLIRSIYLCDFLLSEELRRVVNRILVHGEAVHELQRRIYTGSFSKPRGQHEPELYAASGALTLMTNLCLAWTANKMQEQLLADRDSVPEDHEFDWLLHVSPAHFANINFRGVFNFPLESYARWLFSAAKADAA